MILDVSKVKFDFLSTGFHTCLECGENRILAGWNFCPMCGEPIEWNLSKLASQPTIEADADCEACERHRSNEADYCPFCLKKFNRTA